MIPPTFESYDAWRTAITGICRMELTRAYCRERLAALADDREPSTLAFIRTYGAAYRDRVSEWFLRAGEEALS